MRVRNRRGQRGLSLIEVTIMLLVLMLLTSVLAPSIFDFVTDAQWVKVKEDCEALAISVARLHRDVGARLYTARDGRTDYAGYKMDLMITDGKKPILGTAAVADPSGWGVINNWLSTSDLIDPTNLVAQDHIGTCEEQLVRNYSVRTSSNGGVGAAIYAEPTSAAFGASFGRGWRGAYLSPPCASDPWGNMYQVNTKWATTDFPAGGVIAPHFHCADVFCVSAGKNGVIETPFGLTAYGGTARGGDDWTTVIAPCDP